MRRSAIDSWGRERLRKELGSKSSLSCLPLPTHGWRKNKYVCDSDWSRALSMFRAGNAKLGNRDSALSSLVPHCADYDGTLVECGLCDFGPPSEIHCVVECNGLSVERSSTFRINEMSLESYFDQLRMNGLDTNQLLLRELLDVDSLPSLAEMSSRGRLLLLIRDTYLSKLRQLRDDN